MTETYSDKFDAGGIRQEVRDKGDECFDPRERFIGIGGWVEMGVSCSVDTRTEGLLTTTRDDDSMIRIVSVNLVVWWILTLDDVVRVESEGTAGCHCLERVCEPLVEYFVVGAVLLSDWKDWGVADEKSQLERIRHFGAKGNRKRDATRRHAPIPVDPLA